MLANELDLNKQLLDTVTTVSTESRTIDQPNHYIFWRGKSSIMPLSSVKSLYSAISIRLIIDKHIYIYEKWK